MGQVLTDYDYREIKRIVSKAETGGYYDTKESAISAGFYWNNLDIILAGNAQVAGHLECAVSMHPEGIPDTILYRGGDSFQVVKSRKISFWEMFSNLYNDAVTTVSKSLIILGTISPEAMGNLAAIGKGIKTLIPDYIINLVTKWGEIYQQKAAWINKSLHVKQLELISNVSRVVSPEYDEYVNAAENNLADISNEVFGEFFVLSSYVHIAEMYYFIMAKNAGEKHDVARKKSMEHGYLIARDLRQDIDSYKNNPAKVWGTIYKKTFGDDNPYITLQDQTIDKSIFDNIEKVSGAVKLINDKMTDIGLMDEAFKNAGLISLKDDFVSVKNKWDEFYDDHLKLTMREIDKQDKANKEKLALLEKYRKEDEAQFEKTYPIVTSPKLLNETQFRAQAAFVNDMMKTYLGSDDKEINETFIDINKTLEGLFDAD